MKNQINITESGGCTLYMNLPCHEMIKIESKPCKECIEAQKENQKNKSDAIIDHLESGKSLTKRQSDRVFDYLNLGDLIFKLRKKHGPDYILTKMKKNHVTGSEFAVYYKNPELIKK